MILKKNNNQFYLTTSFIVILFIITIFFFRGNFAYGLNFDEVFRLNNWMSIFEPDAYPQYQGIWYIEILNWKIPIMIREYISIFMIFPYLPVFLFSDYLIGLRFIEAIYFFLSITVFFLIGSKYNLKLSAIISLLLISSPLFYPDIRFGFAWSFHLIFIALGVHLIIQYFKEEKNDYLLFISSLLIFFTANISFYNIWIIISLTITSLIFYFNYWKKIFVSWKKIFLLIVGSSLGICNYIIYNIGNGFPTLKPLLSKILNNHEYNEVPLNYSESAPLLEDIKIKLNLIIHEFIGEYFIYYLIIGIVIFIIYLLCLFILIKNKKLLENKMYFFGLVNVLIIFTFIIISPNAYRIGHYVHLIPFLEISVLSAILLVIKIFKKIRILKILYALIIILLALNIITTNNKIVFANNNKGTGYFSPAIYDLNNFLNDYDINSENTIHLQWGMYSQLYFLNDGNYQINSLVFQLLASENREDSKNIIKDFLSKHQANTNEKTYLPLYNNDNISDILIFDNTILYEVADDLNLSLNIENAFYETDGREIIILYSLTPA